MLENFLHTICNELSISSDFIQIKDHLYHLSINKEITASFSDLHPGIAMSCPLGNVPTTKKEELFIYLSRANLLGQGTGGSRIGLDPSEKLLTLFLGLPYEMNYSSFKQKFEDFINYVLYWREEISTFDGIRGTR
jgi:hypothetical protein